MNKKKNKGTAKKVVSGFLVAVLLVGVTIIGTLAYMSTLSNTKKNTFVGSEGIKLALSETKFDSTTNKLYGPGDIIEKNPQLINFSDEAKTGDSNPNQEEWVAMVVTYSLGENSTPTKYADMQKIIKPITFNDAEWSKITITNLSTKYVMYVYNKTIKRNTSDSGVKDQTTLTETTVGSSSSGSVTSPLFSQIEILPQTGTNTVGGYTTDSLPQFDIEVKGVAIKAEYTNADGELITSYASLDSAQKKELDERLRTLLESNIADGYKVAD